MTKRFLFLAGVALASLFVAGCGPKSAPSSGGGGNVAGGNGGGSVSSVRLAFFPNVTHAVALVGVKSGAFQKALGSVKLETQTFTAGPSEIEALFGDQVDIGYIGPGPAINGFLKSKGRALRIIAGASSGGAALVVRKNAGITEVKSLAGKKVAVPQTGGTQDISLRHAMQQAGLNSADKGGTVTVLSLAPADILPSFIKGELDAAWVPEPWVSRLISEGNGELLIDERTLWPDKKFATTVVIARTAFLQSHPDLVQKFLEAHVETVATMQQNPESARKTVGDQIQEVTGKAVPDALLKDALARTDITYDPVRASVQTFADYSQALGYTKAGQSALGDLFDLKPLNAVLAAQKKPAIP